MSFKIISVIGLGYIGLPTAAMFAAKGKKVIGVDINQHAVDTINAGKIHIVEPELDLIVKKAVEEGVLRATTTPEPADAFLIAVPTPFLSTKEQDSIPEPDLTYIEAAAKSIAKVLKKGDLVILESTSPVGATEKMAEWLSKERLDLTFPHICGEESDIRIAHCPERVIPGNVVKEMVSNDRVIGGITKKCSDTAAKIYEVFVEGDCVITNARTAEMAKLTENSSRDVSIAFANELSIICDELDIDVWELIKISNLHPRVNILEPGPGVGGHCIAVDPWFIVSQTPNFAKIIKTAREVNMSKPEWVFTKFKKLLADYLQNHPSKSSEEINVACYGLTFKPNIDDLRESPAMQITHKILNYHVGSVYIVEPNIDALPRSMSDGKFVTLETAVSSAQINIMLVDHDEFRIIQPNINAEYLLDTKGVWK